MSTLGAIVITLITLILGFIIYRFISFKRKGRQLSREQFARVEPLNHIIQTGQPLEPLQIYGFAKNIQTRALTYQLLKSRNLEQHFPNEFYTIEKSSEAALANWLEFPTELDACPDEIEHIKRVTIDFDGNNNFVHYEVFKCRVNEPHWAAKDGWFLGVVGPYFDDSKPFDRTVATFSRINSKFGQISAEDEAHWVHNNISLKKR